jgi:hypothetical protein
MTVTKENLGTQKKTYSLSTYEYDYEVSGFHPSPHIPNTAHFLKFVSTLG